MAHSPHHGRGGQMARRLPGVADLLGQALGAGETVQRLLQPAGVPQDAAPVAQRHRRARPIAGGRGVVQVVLVVGQRLGVTPLFAAEQRQVAVQHGHAGLVAHSLVDLARLHGVDQRLVQPFLLEGDAAQRAQDFRQAQTVVQPSCKP
ncbi:MAG: hypothetical protein HZY76_03510 [Anaerolineae bacterium]|nr:MAG: hypothetical protein HZY76_03510 [Anaerolineae bacterium]